MKLLCVRPWFCTCKARFKRRATARRAELNDQRIKFDFSTAVERRLKPSRAATVLNSIHKLCIH